MLITYSDAAKLYLYLLVDLIWIKLHILLIRCDINWGRGMILCMGILSLQSVLGRPTSDAIITNTIKMLPVQAIIPLVKELTNCVSGPSEKWAFSSVWSFIMY